MKVEVWSDVICPWCYIGKRRLETALSRFAHAADVEVRWRSFELDPRAPRRREGDLASRIARKYGLSYEQAVAVNANLAAVAANEGLAFSFDRAQPGNTFDAHRLIHLGAARGVQDAVKERLLRAYFVDGEAIGDPETLGRVAAEAGLDAVEAKTVLAGDDYAAEVRADEEEAMTLGISAVPFFLVGRKFPVTGAQDPDVLLGVLERAWAAGS